MLGKIKNKIGAFVESNKSIPFLAALAAGLYPLLYYYNANFTLLNSWSQFCRNIMVYLLVPIVLFWCVNLLFKKSRFLSSYKKYVLPVFNFTFFAFYILLSTYGIGSKKLLLLVLTIAFILAVLLYKQFKKIVVVQFILSALVFAKLVPDIYRYIMYTNAWMEQPDNIENVVFKKRPNVYIVQPDGYANFSELRKPNYNFDNTNFEAYLKNKDFKLYKNYRSNYHSTLSSNSSMFAMKHHYYNNPTTGMNELYNARDVIVGDNPVVSIFKKNNYKTILLLEKSYLLLNRPEIKYDYCNIDVDEISSLSRGYKVLKDIEVDLVNTIDNNTKTDNFYFIEKLKPGHISTYKESSKGPEKERLSYLKELKEANIWLKSIVDIITTKDSNALIVIVADHGGFVGMDNTLQCKEKHTEDYLVQTIFTSALAIKWPKNSEPEFDDFKTSINLFRILFSYLSEDKSYLKHLQDDKSYSYITKGAPNAVYELINEKNEVVFKGCTTNFRKYIKSCNLLRNTYGF